MPPVASTQSVPSVNAVKAALNGVHDPEINRPITELGMVKDVTVAADGTANVAVWLRSPSPGRGPGCTASPPVRAASASRRSR